MWKCIDYNVDFAILGLNCPKGAYTRPYSKFWALPFDINLLKEGLSGMYLQLCLSKNY